MLGGNLEKARAHFEKSLKLADRKFLMTPYLYAKTYAVQTQDKKLFKRLLNEVIDAPGDILPQQRLANELAKIKAKNLLESVDDLF